MRHTQYILLPILLVIFANSKAQDFKATYNVGYEWGIIGYIGNQNTSPALAPYTSLSGAFFSNKHYGLRTGMTYSRGMDNFKVSYFIPISFAYRVNLKQSFPRVDIVNRLMKWLSGSVEFDIGTMLGYLRSDNTTQVDDNFRLDKRMLFCANMAVRPSIQISRFTLGFSIGFGYIPTKNYIYHSTSANLNGIATRWMLQGGGYISYYFDL